MPAAGHVDNVATMNAMRRKAIPAVALLVCVAGFAVSGCGGTVVDSQKAEDAIGFTYSELRLRALMDPPERAVDALERMKEHTA